MQRQPSESPSETGSTTGQSIRFAKALYDFGANDLDELPLEQDDIVKVVKADPAGEWMCGVKNDVWGWFPAGFVRILTDDEAIAEGLLEPEDIGKLVSLPNNTRTAAARRSSINLAESPSITTLAQSASTASLDEAGESGQGLVPGTRNWAAKYKAMPRYSKRVSGTGLDELETAIKAHTKDALSRPKSESPIALLPEDGARRSGSSVKKKEMKFLGGSFSDRGSASKSHSMVSFIGAQPVPRARWLETMGGAEAVAAMGLDKKMIQRQEVIREMILTERDYVQDLETIINIYMNPLKGTKLLPAKDMSIIFSNVEQLHGVNKQLRTWFDERLAENPIVQTIGDIFIRVSDFLKMYTMYCRNHPFALMRLQAVRQSKAVTKFLDQCAASPEAKNLNLANFLIKPVQRICKYPLLIREAMKSTDPTHPDFLNLQSALLKIETVVTIVNEGARQAEAVQKMLEIQGRFTTKMNIVAPWRQLLKSASMELVKANGERSRRESFLFNDMFVLAKSLGGEDQKLKLTDMVPFDKISINIPSGTVSVHGNSIALSNMSFYLPPVGTDHLIEIGHVNAGRYILACDTSDTKQAWIDALKDATRTWLAQKSRGTTPSKQADVPMTSSSTDMLAEPPQPPSLHHDQHSSANHPPARMDAIAEASANIVQPPLPPSQASQTSAMSTMVDDEMVVKDDVPDDEAAPSQQALKSFQNTRVSLTTIQPTVNAPRPPGLSSKTDRSTAPRNNGADANRAVLRPEDEKKAKALALPLLPPLPTKPSPQVPEDSVSTAALITPQAAVSAAVTPPAPSQTAYLAQPSGETGTVAGRRVSTRMALNPFIMQDQSAEAAPRPAAATSSRPPSIATGHSPSSLPEAPKLASPRPPTPSGASGATTTLHRNKPVRRAQVVDVTRPGKEYVYLIDVYHLGAPDDQPTNIRHTYDDFFDLHMQLIGHFPEEAGVRIVAAPHGTSDGTQGDSSSPDVVEAMPGAWNTNAGPRRIIPELPGQMMFVSEAAAKGRVPLLQNYLQSILALPPKLSRSPVTLAFFRSDGKHAHSQVERTVVA
ncbi:Rho guanine nucleotide exchange factor 4 [Thoreauomyces humboldtii]|nr:Rho guanine nucleotide exchange factor 4 [Thoreauomyces humboldtii]